VSEESASASGAPIALTPFQIEVAQLFFSLSASRGFLLAGGAALAAQRLTVRPTRDLDLFTSPGHGVVSNARAALELAARQRGWAAEPVREGQDFVRLVIESNDDNVVVDLAVDAAPECPATMTIAGPTLDPTELAGRKVVALFDRAEARDFADVYALVARYGTDRLLDLAARTDPGFDTAIFADMLDSLARFVDDEVPVPTGEVETLRQFFNDWSRGLRQRT